MAFQSYSLVTSGYRHVGSEMLPFTNHHVGLSTEVLREKKIVVRAWPAYQNIIDTSVRWKTPDN